MKDSVITLLNGIKAWGDARISRLREELQRRIIDAKKYGPCGKAICR